MNIEYSLDKSLYQKMLNDVQLIFCTNSNSSLQVNLYTGFAAIGVTGLALFGFSLDYSAKTEPIFLVAAVMFISALPLSWFMNRQFMSSYNKSVLKEYQGSFNKNISLDINEAGILYESEGSSSNITWEVVSNIYAANSFFIIISDALLISIPYQSMSGSDNKRISEFLVGIEEVSKKKVIKMGLASSKG